MTELELVRGTADNPHGLTRGPQTAEEHEALRVRLVEARDTAYTALEHVEKVRLAGVRPDGPVVLPPIVWWGEPETPRQ